MTRFQIIVIALLAIIALPVVAIITLPIIWHFNDHPGRALFGDSSNVPANTGLNSFAYEMGMQGRFLNYADNRWYPFGELASHHCMVKAPPWNATNTINVTSCRVPLTGGIPNKDK
jgi:hypothetical protein